MQEQNFEKQVQQKMDGFSLTPSVPVWQNIEKEIRQKKERRRFIFWVFPLFLIGTSSIWWVYTPSEKEKHTFSKTSSSINRSLGTANSWPNESEKTSTSTVTNSFSSDNKKLPDNNLSDTTALRNNNPLTITPLSKPVKKHTDNNTQQLITSTLQNQTTALITPNIKNRKVQLTHQQKSATVFFQVNSIPEEDSSLRFVQKVNKIDAILIHNNNENKAIELLLKTDTNSFLKINPLLDSIQKHKNEKKVAKWKWVIQATYGISSAQTALLSTATQADKALYSSIDLNGTATPAPTPITSSPSKLEKSTAIGLSFLAKRSLHPRLTITTGLSYHRFSTKNYVGKSVQKDTILQFATTRATLSQYYRNDPTKTYKNNYHFIELPIGIEWQLFKKLPLHLQSGVSLSYLIATNAVVYDANAGIYYQNDKLYSKTQLHFNIGLTYQVWKHKNTGIHFGPYMQYGITGLQKEKNSNNYHLFSAGLKTQFSF